MGNISSFKPTPPAEHAWPEYERAPMPDAEATARLLEEMSQGSLGPISRLQEALNMTVEQIADWMAHPRHRFVAANLVNLYDVQTQLIVCQHRLIAVAKLTEVITTAESPETVRRACKDLLSVRLIDPYREDERPVIPPPPAEVNEERILEALERLGGEGWGDDDEEGASECGGGGSAAACSPCSMEAEGARPDSRGRATARAAFTDGGVKASLPVVNGGFVDEEARMDGAPARAQTKPYGGAGCARSGSRADSTGDDPRFDPHKRAPPRATVRRY